MEKVYDSEYKLLTILWEKEAVSSPELVKLCNEKYNWKKSTTYTIIKKLSDKGMVKSENTIVTPLITKKEADRDESDRLLNRISQGNVASFLVSFFEDRKLTKEDIKRIQKIIDEAEVDE